MFMMHRDAGKTFKPQPRRAEPGTRRYELHKLASATLGAGNLLHAVKLPAGEVCWKPTAPSPPPARRNAAPARNQRPHSLLPDPSYVSLPPALTASAALAATAAATDGTLRSFRSCTTGSR